MSYKVIRMPKGGLAEPSEESLNGNNLYNQGADPLNGLFRARLFGFYS